MSTALATRDDTAIAVTPEQLDLIKRTVANGATADELKLYLFDCQRQGVHPLDKLVHFTKRSGKYTPITSIDFMRIRAADTGEYAGSDDAVFADAQSSGEHLMASVTVWRLVQGQRCAFAATARWSEYKPEQNDFMWRKMPHTMLAKCAEALALRKGFPRQLAGLYAKEEMDQAGSEAPAAPVVTRTALVPPPTADGAIAAYESERAAVVEGPDLETDCPEGFHRIHDYRPEGQWHHITWGVDAQGGRPVYRTKLAKIGIKAQKAFNEQIPVQLVSKKYPFLDDVVRMDEEFGMTPKDVEATKWRDDSVETPL